MTRRLFAWDLARHSLRLDDAPYDDSGRGTKPGASETDHNRETDQVIAAIVSAGKAFFEGAYARGRERVMTHHVEVQRFHQEGSRSRGATFSFCKFTEFIKFTPGTLRLNKASSSPSHRKSGSADQPIVPIGCRDGSSQSRWPRPPSCQAGSPADWANRGQGLRQRELRGH